MVAVDNVLGRALGDRNAPRRSATLHGRVPHCPEIVKNVRELGSKIAEKTRWWMIAVPGPRRRKRTLYAMVAAAAAAASASTGCREMLVSA